MCGRLPCWQEFFGGDARLVGAAMCPAFLMWRSPMAAGHNALREIGSRSQKLLWHKWRVPISGSTGWVHPRIALSNLIGARKARASLKLPAEQALCNMSL